MRQAAFSLSRLGALSDGVFAIALTLLVLDLKLPVLDVLDSGSLSAPTQSSSRFENALLQQLPHFLSWLLSFAILARLWTVQHALLVGGNHRTRAFMAWNFVFLGAVSVLPFTTSLIGERYDHPLSTVVFSLTLAMGGVALDRMWDAEKHFFTEEAKTNAAVSSPRTATILLLSIAAVSCMVSLIHPQAGLVIWVAFPLAEPLVRLVATAKTRKSPNARQQKSDQRIWYVHCGHSMVTRAGTVPLT